MELAHYTATALAAVQAAGSILRRYYRQPIDTQTKADSSPVTQADRESEHCIRRFLTQSFPTHGIIGEEEGRHNVAADFVWVIDPLDGTASFMTGRPLFGVLLALVYKGESVLGIIHQPITGELWLGRKGHPTTLNGVPVRTTAAPLADSAVGTTGCHYFSPEQQATFTRVAAASRFPLQGGDCYLYGQLANGNLAAVVEAGLAAHDIAALLPIVQGAGGIVTTWQAQPVNPLATGKQTLVASANAVVHQEVLSFLNT